MVPEWASMDLGGIYGSRMNFPNSKISLHAVDVPHCSYDSVMNADRSLYSVLVINKPKKDINNQH